MNHFHYTNGILHAEDVVAVEHRLALVALPEHLSRALHRFSDLDLVMQNRHHELPAVSEHRTLAGGE